LFCLLLYPLKE